MIRRLTTANLVTSSEIPFPQFLAKSRKTNLNTVIEGRLVFSHCHIVGSVACELMARLPDWLRNELFPQGSELIAAAHDIGKISPTFQHKIYAALSTKDIHILAALKAFPPDLEKSWGGHAGVSQATAKALQVGKYIPEVLGQHHGFSPNISLYTAHSEVFGGDVWDAERVKLLAELKAALNTTFPIIENALQARVLSGLTSVSDWIGSGPRFEDPEADWHPEIVKAVDEAGFIRPQYKAGLSFSDIFGFNAKPAQLKLIESVTQSGVYVLEAPMGLGKTEAALYAAYTLLAQHKSTGFYFALPTQLTSDKIHERVNQFLEQILDDASPHKQALLLHGSAWLKQEMGEEGNPDGAWFAQGKRGILAPFAVGTIDQALMAVMNVKHGFVRTFGLAGKVVILDEVHSYDSFTGTILDELVKTLRALHCTVIILSATLTQERRGQLLGIPVLENHYPLITAQPNIGELTEVAVDTMTDVNVIITHSTDAEAIEEVLLRAEQGQQVLWIENTVREAQTLYRKLAARAHEMGVDCGLLHSRFSKIDRAANESTWVTRYGKAGAATRNKHGRILVGTQVLEQSLDIDADFLISRVAPTDMLLQRFGRLWRHTETIRPDSARREAWLLSPHLEAAIATPESAFGDTARVYAPYVLCRSLAVWQHVTEVSLPGQIRALIEATYAPQAESEQMLRHLEHIKSERKKLATLALRGLSQGGKTQSEESAQTRHSELETTEVLLLRAYQPEPHKNGTTVILLNGQTLFLPKNGRAQPRSTWRELTATLLQNTLKVAEYLAPKPISRSELLWLGDYFYLGRPEYGEDTALLRVALVDESGAVKLLNHGVANDNYTLNYDDRIGYQTKKNGR